MSENATCSWDTTTTPTMGSMVLLPGEEDMLRNSVQPVVESMG
jgi:hypothetical protein